MEISIAGRVYRVTARVGKILLWLLEHMVEVSAQEKCKLEFNMAGDDVRAMLAVFYG